MRDLGVFIDPRSGMKLSPGGVYVRFDKTQYDPKTGKELHGKLYDSMEEAIQDMGAKIPERVMRDGEEIPVTVPVLLNKWVEE